jgi:hypothetical protein
MVRIVLILGLFFACVQQGLALGKVDLSVTADPLVMTGTGFAVSSDAVECCEGTQTTETKSSRCISDCKAVIATASIVPPKTSQEPDGNPVSGHSSIIERLEPRPPKS